MRLIKVLRQGRLMPLAAVVSVVLAGAAIWLVSTVPGGASAPGASKDKQKLQERLRKGVGSEVHFASPGDTQDQVAASVGSVADFIRMRSGMKMSDETRKKLVSAESELLMGKTQYMQVGELVDSLTGAVVDRLATITDKEIQQAADASANADGEVRSRADARMGVLSKDEFIAQVKSGREWSKRGDAALQVGLRPMIEEEVNSRVAALGEAMPEMFGQAATRGVTPTQALLIAYSVAADDSLADSQADIAQMRVQKRMEQRLTREQEKARKDVSILPYGSRGFAHPSAANLFFNKAAVDRLLNRGEGGKK